MITFKNNNLTYVPSVDLTTLGNTFNTLEEGHKKAIQTASELENTIAKLEMDESESDFKEGLIADIQNTIEKYGGKFSETINKRTTMLINNDINSKSSKNIKAKTMGIKIITEKEFINMIGVDFV